MDVYEKRFTARAVAFLGSFFVGRMAQCHICYPSTTFRMVWSLVALLMDAEVRAYMSCRRGWSTRYWVGQSRRRGRRAGTLPVEDARMRRGDEQGTRCVRSL
eukprot:559783-Pyramimonas_sp.AAC.1